MFSQGFSVPTVIRERGGVVKVLSKNEIHSTPETYETYFNDQNNDRVMSRGIPGNGIGRRRE
jgi:hypothetical protein